MYLRDPLVAFAVAILLTSYFAIPRASEIHLPSGEVGYKITCRDTLFTKGAARCIKKAGKVCNYRGYDVVERGPKHMIVRCGY